MRRKSNEIWNPIFVNAVIVNLLVHICTTMMNTLTAKYADSLGAIPAMVGFTTGAFAVTALVFKMISAPAIDTFNHKYIMLGSLFCIFLAFLCYSFSKTIPMLIFSRLLQGTGQAFSTTCCLTIAASSLPTGKMAGGIGYFSLGTAASQAIAPTLGLKLVENIGYNKTFLILAAVMFLAMFFTSIMRISHRRSKRFRITLNSVIAQECFIPAFILFLLSTTFCLVKSFLILFAESQGIYSNIGFFFTVYAVTLLFTRPMIGKLADKYGVIKVLIPSLICFALAFVMISFSSTLHMFLLAGFISAFGFGGSQPTIQAVCMKSVARKRRGAASCTSYIGTDLGNLAGPVIAGLIIQRFGYVAMWRTMITPVLIAVIISLIFRYRISNAGEILEE